MAILRDYLVRLKKRFEQLNYGRDIVTDWVARHATGRATLKVVDLGVGNGRDLLNLIDALGDDKLELWGVDFRESERLRQQGIQTVVADVEADNLPFEDASFDVVIANQIIEHTKEIFWIFSEVSRITAPGGIVVVGVPNLASFHNRVALLTGEQPTCIEIFGPHVRGFTKPSFIRFAEHGGFFEALEVRGSNFYPFPPAVSKPLSRLLPTMSVGLFFLLRRTHRPGTFRSVLDGVILETLYRGMEPPTG